MTLTIHVPDAQAKALAEEMEQRGYAVVLETEEEAQVPQWQIDEVRRRMAQANRPPARPWSEIREEYVRKGLL